MLRSPGRQSSWRCSPTSSRPELPPSKLTYVLKNSKFNLSFEKNCYSPFILIFIYSSLLFPNVCTVLTFPSFQLMINLPCLSKHKSKCTRVITKILGTLKVAFLRPSLFFFVENGSKKTSNGANYVLF